MIEDYDGISDNLRLYFKEIGYCKLLSKEKEKELSLRIRDGDTNSLGELAMGCAQFVVDEAFKRNRQSGRPLDDLIGDGNFGLLEAATKYDGSEHDNKFISYAVWWIHREMDMGTKQDVSILKLKHREIDRFIEIRKTLPRLEQIHGREVKVSDIADYTGYSIGQVIDALRLIGHLSYLDDEFENEDGGRKVSESIEDKKYTPDNVYNNIEAREIVNIVNTLPKRLAKIIISYYGLDGEPARSFKEIGASLGITGQRVKQLKDQALKRLEMSNGQVLREVYDEL